MQKTVAGLPNSCSVCGKALTREDGWYAEHDDAARSGVGICADCNALKPTPGEDLQESIHRELQAQGNAAANASTATSSETVVLEAWRNAQGEFVSPDDQDADGKPEVITHGKRGTTARK